MPFELTTTADDIMFARLFGVFTALDLNHLASEAEISEAAHPVSLDRMTDLTAVERFEVGFREIFHFAIRRSTQRFSRVVKSALIVDALEQLEMARMYEAMNENPQIALGIVRSVPQAKEWFADRTETPGG